MSAAEYTATGVASVFLDRDGVVNRRRTDHVKSWSEFEFLPGVLEALSALRQAGTPVIVVTNQAMVGRGLVLQQELMEIHGRMLAAVALAGGHIERIYACTHRPEQGCGCRKPGTDLFFRASRELGVSLPCSVVVGDSESDVEAARKAGCEPILVGRERPPGQPIDLPLVPNLSTALPLIQRLTQRVVSCC